MQVMSNHMNTINYGSSPSPANFTSQLNFLTVKLYETTFTRHGAGTPIFFELFLNSDTTVSTVKDYVLEKFNIPVEEQRLEINGQTYNDSQFYLTNIGADCYGRVQKHVFTKFSGKKVLESLMRNFPLFFFFL
jgi:hypothetical protein